MEEELKLVAAVAADVTHPADILAVAQRELEPAAYTVFAERFKDRQPTPAEYVEFITAERSKT